MLTVRHGIESIFLSYGRVTYRFSYSMRHNDARGSGVIGNGVLKTRNVSKFMNYHLLLTSFSCPATAHLCS